MFCYNCGCHLSEHDFCTSCGADVSLYKKIMCMSNRFYNDGLEKAGVRDLTGAINSLRQSLKFNKNNIEARNLLGLVYFETGEVVAALSEWVISKNMRPEKNIADDYINMLQSNATRLDAINQTIKKYNQALVYCNQDSKDLARIQLKKVLSDHPNFVQAHLLLALLYMDAADWEKARKELTRCLRIDCANTTALRYMHEVDIALKTDDDGKFVRKQGKGEEVVKYQSGNENTPGKKQKEEQISYQSGNETIIQPISQIEPKKSFGWLWGTLAGLAVGVAVSWFLILPARVQIAQTELNNKLTAVGEEADRKNAEISSLNQQIETLTKENDELTAQNGKLSGADGSMSAVEALLNAASVYMETPDDIEALSEAVDKISRDAMESSDTSEAARKLYQQLLQDTGTDLAANYYDTGYKAYRSGDYETAIENLTKAVSYDETNSEALYALANSYRDNGNKRQAKETYQKVIELFPNTEKATQSQRALDQLDN